MPQVAVTISGRTYRIACSEGEERHLETLAAMFDGKISEMRTAFGEIGDMRLHVMAALTFADELDERTARLAAAEGELAALRERTRADDERAQASEIYMAETLAKTAERIERLAKTMNAQPPHASRPRKDEP